MCLTKLAHWTRLQLSFDLVEDWLEKNPDALGLRREGASVLRELALFQDYHGLPAFKNVISSPLGRVAVAKECGNTVKV